jgi:hypothetical protein
MSSASAIANDHFSNSLSEKADTSAHLSFDDQLRLVFQSASGHGGGIPVSVFVDEKNKPDDSPHVLNAIYQKILAHEIKLKNVVFRNDSRGIRVTFADDKNHYIYKATYKTASDPVLTNSVYADKNELVDIKIMYLSGDEYKYISIQNDKGQKKYVSMPQSPEDRSQKQAVVDSYTVLTSLSNEKCGFCHVVAQNDGNKQGLFFPRYQETTATTQKEIDAKSIFRSDDFSKTVKGLVNLNIPNEMTDEFYFNSVSREKNGDIDVNKYARTLFEMPELVEVLAKDNQKSYCINVDFGKNNPAMRSDNYVCADYKNKKLFVYYHNPFYVGGKGVVKDVRPFY